MNETKIKIVHILHCIGGVDVSLRLLLGSIDPKHFKNIVIHGTSDTDLPFVGKNGDTIKEYKTTIVRNINPFWDLNAAASIFRIIKKEKPNIIHVHSAKGGVLGRIVNIYFKLPSVHSPQAYSFLSSGNTFLRKFYVFIERLLLSKNGYLLASSLSEKKRGIKILNYPEDQTFLFLNAIKEADLEVNSNIKTLSIPREYIVSVGRPSPQKNIEMMIEVLHEVKKTRPSIHLVLLGIGKYSPNLKSIKKRIEKYQLNDNISLVKWMERDEVLHVIKNSLFYISTAKYEGLPYSIIESLGLGKACVVTDCDGNRDLVRDEFNGFIIPLNEVELMKEKILILFENQELRKKFEANSKSFFQKYLLMDKNIHHLEKFYREIVD